MSSEAEEASDREEENNVIDDIESRPRKRQRPNKRKPIDVMRVPPVSSLCVKPDDWQAQRYSIPYDPFDDEFFEQSDSGSRQSSSTGSDDESNDESNDESDDESDDESEGESAAGSEDREDEQERGLMPVQEARNIGRDELPAEPDNPRPDVPVNMPADMMLWAVTRFMRNGGMDEDEAAFRTTMRELWSQYIADMLSQGNVVFQRANGPASQEKDDEEEDECCWMCEYGLGIFDKLLSTHITEMKRLFEIHVLQMHPKTLAGILWRYYQDYVYTPMKNKGKNPPRWSKRMAEEHLTVHVRDVRVRLMMLDSRMTDTIDMMYDNLFAPHEDDPDRMVHHPEVLKDLNSVFDRWLKLRNQKPQTMVGYNPELNIDLNGGSDLIRYANLKVQTE